MNTQSTHAWQARRKKSLLFAVLMLILLLLATAFVVYARQNLRQSQTSVAVSQRTNQEAHWMEEEAKDVSLLDKETQQLMQAAASHGVSPSGWAERRINLKQTQMTRNEANELLLSVARTEGRLFDVEEFDIGVTRDDEGLFTISDHPNTPLLLSVRGTAVFRTGK